MQKINDELVNKLAKSYSVPQGEEHLYHAVIEIKQFDGKTGERLSRPRVQKFGKKMFESVVLSELKKQGYTITIIHNPNEWLKINKEKQAAVKKIAEAKAKETADKRFQEAVAKEVAAQLAKVKK